MYCLESETNALSNKHCMQSIADCPPSALLRQAIAEKHEAKEAAEKSRLRHV
jgi:hypothetical protein